MTPDFAPALLWALVLVQTLELALSLGFDRALVRRDHGRDCVLFPGLVCRPCFCLLGCRQLQAWFFRLFGWPVLLPLLWVLRWGLPVCARSVESGWMIHFCFVPVQETHAGIP